MISKDKRAEISLPSRAKRGQTSFPGRQRLASLWKRQRDLWLLLGMVLLSMSIIALLSSIESTARTQVSTTLRATPSPSTAEGTATRPSSPPPIATVRAAMPRLYTVAATNVGLMQPAVDAQGNVWVGEMVTNRLARFDSQTGAVTTWEPPNAQSGIMTTVIDTQGKVWFVEQSANYIGRFDPVRQQFHLFPLGTVRGRPMGPQTLLFDATGSLWFTAVTAGQIGRLNPTTGSIQTWDVPAPRVGILPMPFSLTLTPDGQVWFGLLSGGTIGHLDPSTGQVTLFPLADAQASVFSLAHDAKGRIWFTELLPGKLGTIDLASKTVTELPVPTTQNIPAALYAVVVTPDGNVWFANNTADALIRYVPASASYTVFRFSSPSSAPYGLTLDPAGALWFTAASTPFLGTMRPE